MGKSPPGRTSPILYSSHSAARKAVAILSADSASAANTNTRGYGASGPVLSLVLRNSLASKDPGAIPWGTTTNLHTAGKLTYIL